MTHKEILNSEELLEEQYYEWVDWGEEKFRALPKVQEIMKKVYLRVYGYRLGALRSKLGELSMKELADMDIVIPVVKVCEKFPQSFWESYEEVLNEVHNLPVVPSCDSPILLRIERRMESERCKVIKSVDHLKESLETLLAMSSNRNLPSIETLEGSLRYLQFEIKTYKEEVVEVEKLFNVAVEIGVESERQ